MQTQAPRADKAHEGAPNTNQDESRRERELAIIEEALNGGSAASHASTQDCRQLRERVDAGRFPREVAGDVPWDRRTVAAHAYGRCQHDESDVGPEAEPPTKAAAAGRETKVTRDDCQAMRARSQRGDLEADIADVIGVSRSTAFRHIRGSCSRHADEEGDGS